MCCSTKLFLSTLHDASHGVHVPFPYARYNKLKVQPERPERERTGISYGPPALAGPGTGTSIPSSPTRTSPLYFLRAVRVGRGAEFNNNLNKKGVHAFIV